MSYREADEVRDIANALIMAHHEHLSDEPFKFVFREKAGNKLGKPILGTAGIVTGRNAYFALSEAEAKREMTRQETLSFFVIEVAEDTWEDLPERQREALVDHLLTQCWACDVEKGKGENKHEVRSLSLRGPDVQEFESIVRRYGFWRESVQSFAKVAVEVAQQSSLFENLSNSTEPVVEEEPAEDEQPVAVQTGGSTRKKK